ncbi:ABC transporter permease [Streptomyces sp. SID3343]|uniref:FtsX-like permease family protein n=1 Tax=Streptomyces sp. SID3343 TaxID=2690260 RepID=UPI001368DDE8|nr:ABC transporter permease [Streptomyces sp. SID3343]MYW02896.1 FtsX-like permease family protein [Streptomyces sp. SID3343]
MYGIPVRTLRLRWPLFTGTFIALTLGVCLVSALGLGLAAALDTAAPAPRRYGAAPVVVHLDEKLKVPASSGHDSAPLAERKGLPAELIADVTATGPTVVDRTFPATVAGGPSDQVGHGWSAAAFTPYELASGRAPERDDEIVATAGPGAVGEPVRVLTADGPRMYTVVGRARPVDFESAVFFTDAEAARISPRVDALVAYGPLDAITGAVHERADIRTGGARREAEPTTAREQEDLDNTAILLGVSAGVAGFVAIFVVASTCALGVARRHGEFALLRMVGATPRGVRRVVLREIALVGTLAAGAGCALSLPAAPALGRALVREHLAPAGYTVGWSTVPVVVAFATGVTVALLGAWTAAHRAGRVRPIEALRTAAVEVRPTTRLRLLIGVGLIGGALVMLGQGAITEPASALNRKQYIPVTMLLITGVAVLAPTIVAPLARALTGILRPTRPGGRLARANSLALPRRTASIAAPILVTIGLAGALIGVADTARAAKVSAVRNTVDADFVIAPQSPGGLNRAVVEQVRTTPGVDAAATVPTTMYTVEGGVALIPRPAHAVDPATWSPITGVRVLAGSLADLADDTIVVDEDWSQQTVGQRVRVWAGDGTPVTLRIAAVVHGDPGSFVSSRFGRGTLPDAIYVKLRQGTDHTVAEAHLRARTRELGADVLRADEWGRAPAGGGGRHSRAGVAVIVGLAVLYTSVAIVNTTATVTFDRRRYIAALRLAGATNGQVTRYLAGETLIPIAVGFVLAAGVTAVQLGGTWIAAYRYAGPTGVVLPWAEVGVVTVVAAGLALAATVIPALVTMRDPAIRAVGAER